jgi:hypothetical protein
MQFSSLIFIIILWHGDFLSCRILRWGEWVTQGLNNLRSHTQQQMAGPGLPFKTLTLNLHHLGLSSQISSLYRPGRTHIASCPERMPEPLELISPFSRTVPSSSSSASATSNVLKCKIDHATSELKILLQLPTTFNGTSTWSIPRLLPVLSPYTSTRAPSTLAIYFPNAL